MSKLAEASIMADIRAALLKLLLHLEEDDTFTLDDAAEEVKVLLREVEAIQYPFE